MKNNLGLYLLHKVTTFKKEINKKRQANPVDLQKPSEDKLAYNFV